MSFASVIHLDTSVFLPIIDRKKLIVSRDEFSALRSFAYRLTRNNQKVKVSIVVLGEILKKAIEGSCIELVEELQDFALKMKNRLELCYIPKFRNSCNDFCKILQEILDVDDYLRDNPSDALILTIAVLDEEADVLYTIDSTLLISSKVHNFVNQTRQEYGFKRLTIKSPI